jgi:dTMP kinase
MRGKLIVIEGTDGAGKSTLSESLSENISKQHHLVRYAEPGGTAAGEQIRWMIKNSAMPINDQAEALLFAAARAQLASQIEEDLHAGSWVLLDRWVYSSIAYQGAARGLGMKAVEDLNRWATGGLRPDLWIYLRLTAEEAVARRGTRGETIDRIEQEGEEFFAAVSEAYERLAAEDPDAIVLNAHMAPDKLSAAAWKQIQGLS